ncbi:hypothetical protein ABN763_10430 [Spongiivirga sp. MCCC 1A20706]|uniref:DinB family protein n=1 Tax=Spongiivirga sp. MCCC 1A20706 TaxID=3160963 RepID=UPI0039776B63
MKNTLIFLIITLLIHSMSAQSSELPLKQIPPAEKSFTSGNVIARMIEGLGHRYYWASKDLKENDLAYKPSDDARNMLETLQHIYGLSSVIKNGPSNTVNTRGEDLTKYSYAELRKMTLENLNNAATQLKGKSADDVAKMKVIFKRGEQESAFPFWNMINGPIADAIYHTGQVVTMRRSNGNPIQSGVNVFLGTTKE